MIVRNKKYQSLLTGLFAGMTAGSVIIIDWFYVQITNKEGIYFKWIKQNK